jgi:hypothetical protein
MDNVAAEREPALNGLLLKRCQIDPYERLCQPITFLANVPEVIHPASLRGIHPVRDTLVSRRHPENNP